jgi:hypothetical protein
MDVVIIVPGERDLLQIVAALGSPCRLACRLHGWQQERNQDCDNRDDGQKLDQRETAPPTHGPAPSFVVHVAEPILSPFCNLSASDANLFFSTLAKFPPAGLFRSLRRHFEPLRMCLRHQRSLVRVGALGRAGQGFYQLRVLHFFRLAGYCGTVTGDTP